MIKKREWTKDILKLEENVQNLKFEDFYIRIKKEENKIKKAVILGHTAIDFTKFNIVELTFQKIPTKLYIESHEINTEIYEYNSKMIYLVSILSLEALQNFKYTEKLNLLTFAFEKESIALLFLSTLEDLRYKLWSQNFLKEENE